MAVAQNAKLIPLCARVLPEGSDGSGVSRRECEVSLTSRAGGASYGGAGAALLLFAMGYDENDIRRVYPMHPETPRFDQFLSSLEQTDEIRDRLTRLPDFSKGDRTARQQVQAAFPRCVGTGQSLGCEVIACGFLRDAGDTDRCIERVQGRFDRFLGVIRPVPYKSSTDCPGNTSGLEVSARATVLSAIFIDTRAALDMNLHDFAPDAVLWPPGEPPVRGTAAIRDWYLRSLDQFWTCNKGNADSRSSN